MKKYRVVLPNPHGEGKRVFALIRTAFGISISRLGKQAYYFNRDSTELTEAEIKQEFEWAWPFAVPVEE
ncbi:hypothetical protein ACVR1G_08165 [Streptococcus dentasini]